MRLRAIFLKSQGAMWRRVKPRCIHCVSVFVCVNKGETVGHNAQRISSHIFVWGIKWIKGTWTSLSLTYWNKQNALMPLAAIATQTALPPLADPAILAALWHIPSQPTSLHWLTWSASSDNSLNVFCNPASPSNETAFLCVLPQLEGR